ncbi:putative cob(I)alamin adenosyltransferase [Candidatus Hodgkinia cicadicola]|nr:putative cob(I)alamin adenosyltransferase [Candidatus Hodgkinia cicadicola]
MPRDLRFHNYIRKGLLLCLYGSGKFKTSSCLGFFVRANLRDLPCVFIKAGADVWDFKQTVCTIKNVNNKSNTAAILATRWCIICKIVGDPTWLYVILDELTLSYRRKLKTNFLFTLRPSFQTVCLATRRQMPAHCVVKFSCSRNHYTRGFGARVGLEY